MVLRTEIRDGVRYRFVAHNSTQKQIKAKKKPLYHVTLNWKGEVHDFWKHAHSTQQAVRLAIKSFVPQTMYKYRYVASELSAPHRVAVEQVHIQRGQL